MNQRLLRRLFLLFAVLPAWTAPLLYTEIRCRDIPVVVIGTNLASYQCSPFGGNSTATANLGSLTTFVTNDNARAIAQFSAEYEITITGGSGSGRYSLAFESYGTPPSEGPTVGFETWVTFGGISEYGDSGSFPPSGAFFPFTYDVPTTIQVMVRIEAHARQSDSNQAEWGAGGTANCCGIAQVEDSTGFFGSRPFTMRLVTEQVPEPGTWALLLAGLAYMYCRSLRSLAP